LVGKTPVGQLRYVPFDLSQNIKSSTSIPNSSFILISAISAPVFLATFRALSIL
jgi:hypothetical protein